MYFKNRRDFCKSMKLIFLHATNMKSFIYDTAENFGGSLPGKQDYLFALLSYLQSEKIVLNNLEKFEWRTDSNTFDYKFPFTRLCVIFPRLRSLYLPIIDLDFMVMRNDFPIHAINLKELSNIQFHLYEHITEGHRKALLLQPRFCILLCSRNL